MSEFRIPPVSTLIGSTPLNYLRIMQSGDSIDSRFYGKVVLTSLLVGLMSPVYLRDRFYQNQQIRNFKFKNSPVFILGHWRSGTTFLHNLLCQDPRAAFVSTYQSLFPSAMGTQWLLKPLMSKTMPDHRPSDHVKLGVDLPQEDEFAVGNLNYRSFYNFFYFPRQYRDYRKLSVDDVNAGMVSQWDKMYSELLIKAILNTGGDRLIVKNPVNTARIKSLLRIFPNAKFIFIYRNPIITFLSTKKFFKAVMPSLWFHEVDDLFIDEMILDNFNYIINQYELQKKLIPQDQLLEIRYEEFKNSPFQMSKDIYSKLIMDDFAPAHIPVQQFLDLQNSHETNRYEISNSLLVKLTHQLKGLMDLWNYKVPDDLKVS